MKIIYTVCLWLLLLPNLAVANTSTPVFKAIAERLSYMEDVALFKAKNSLAIEDLQRESRVLEKAVKGARDRGIESESIAEFYRAQISAAKAIQ